MKIEQNLSKRLMDQMKRHEYKEAAKHIIKYQIS